MPVSVLRSMYCYNQSNMPTQYRVPRNAGEVAAQVERAIRSGDLQPGDQLAPIRSLAAEFALAVVGGALDGIERCLQANLRAGDAVAVEDPGFTSVFDLLASMHLRPVPVAVDERGPDPDALAGALGAGVHAFVLTPRAQNPG